MSARQRDRHDAGERDDEREPREWPLEQNTYNAGSDRGRQRHDRP
jgi:hypothetical protein